MKAKELELNANTKIGNNLYAKGRTKKKESSNVFDQSGGSGTKRKKKYKKAKQKPKWKCYHCAKEGYIKKYCYDYIRKHKQEVNASIATNSDNVCLF